MSDNVFFHIPKTGKRLQVESVKKALEKVATGGYLWLSYCDPTFEELSLLAEPLGIHPLTIEDCLDDRQIPKVDDYPEYTFLLFNSFRYYRDKLAIGEVNLILGQNFLITIQRSEAGGTRPFDPAGHYARLDAEIAKAGPAMLMYLVLDDIVDQKFAAIEALSDELVQVEDRVLDDLSAFNPASLQRIRRDLLAMHKSLFHEREILANICGRDFRFIPEKAVVHYRDIFDHVAKFFELTETNREVVTNLMQIHLALQNNLMTKASNQTNASVRRLTLITTVFMPLTLLSGIGGMSEFSMMTGPDQWRIAYPVFLAVMALLGVGNYFILRRLERKDKDKDKD